MPALANHFVEFIALFYACSGNAFFLIDDYYKNSENPETIFRWAPKYDQWWITGFKPDFTNQQKDEMAIIGSIDFSKLLIIMEAIIKIKSLEVQNLQSPNDTLVPMESLWFYIYPFPRLRQDLGNYLTISITHTAHCYI